MPVSDVEKLISDISRAFPFKIGLPAFAEESGFCIPFFDDGTPQPRFLGTSTSRGHFQEMELQIPPPMVADFGPPRHGMAEMDRSFEAFRQKMMMAVEATKRKSKYQKDKKRQARVQTHLDWLKQLKRTQRYMGLRAHVRELPEPDMTGLEWEEQQKKYEEYLLATNQKLLPLDVSKPVPYPFDQGVVFVCIDVESNEHVHEQITETGVSTLDTLDLVGVPPGEGGKNWMTKIRSRHFRIVEYSHVVNETWIQGCADKFEYGTSEWISHKNAAKAIDSCFKHPYSAGFTHGLSKARYLDAQYQDFVETKDQTESNTDNAIQANRTSAQDYPNGVKTEADAKVQAVNSDEMNIDRYDIASSSGSCPEHTATEVSSTTTIEVVNNHQKEGGSTASTHEVQKEDRISTGNVGFHKPVFTREDGTAITTPMASFDFEALIAARKFLAQRVKEDPTLLDDPILQPNFQKKGKTIAPPTEGNVDRFLKLIPQSETSSATKFSPNTEPAQPSRPLILLGHDTKSDLGYLRLLSYDPQSYNPSLLEALDTAAMYRILKRESNAPKLGNILVDLGLTGWHLHNAGNDARYTMEAMIGIVIKARKVEDDGGRDLDEVRLEPTVEGQEYMSEMERKIARETEEARLRVIEEYDTWASVPGLAAYLPPKPTNNMVSLVPYSSPSPPVANFKDEFPNSPTSQPQNFTFHSIPPDTIDGGEAVPITPSKKSKNANSKANNNTNQASSAPWRTFTPGSMDKVAVEAELAKQVEFDWDSDALKIDGKAPVETTFQRIVRERRETKAELEKAEMMGKGESVLIDSSYGAKEAGMVGKTAQEGVKGEEGDFVENAKVEGNSTANLLDTDAV
jgi:hypothetical protein